MGQTLSNFDHALKHFYLPPIQQALPMYVELYDEFKKDTESWQGNQVIESINVSENVGVGARTDRGVLPTAGNQGFQPHIVTNKNNYARIEVTGPVIRASKTAEGAFAKAMTVEMEGASRNLGKDLDRQMWGGGVGTLATVKTGVSSATVVVKYAGSSATPVSGEPGTRFLKAGMVVNIGTTAEHAAGTAENATVSSITDKTTVVFADSETVVADDIIVRAGTAALLASAYSYEIEGIDTAMVTTGAYQNITVTNYPDAWKANVRANSGANRTLTEELMQQIIDDNYDGDGKTDLILAHTSMRAEINKLLTPDKRYLSNKNLSLGTAGDVFYNDIKIKFMRQCQYNRLYFLTRDSWTLYVQDNLKWADEDGKILSKVSGYDAYEALLVFPGNLGCNRPRANGILKDISVTLPTT